MDAEERLLENGYENVKILKDFSYDTALIGIPYDDRPVYDFDKMVEWLMETQGYSQEEAIEWIEYNTIRALPYMRPDSPVILYPLKD